jgi:glycosyltransferase involved in cell wall biosynthesis
MKNPAVRDRKTLAIDARWLVTGIGRYTLNLLRHLRPLTTGFHLQCVTMAQHAETIAPYSDGISIVNASIYTLREQFELPRALHASDLLHVPHYNVPLFRRGPLLLTIGDLTHLLDPRHRRNIKTRLYAEVMLRLAAARADHLFTFSEYSKRHIVERLGVPANRVTVMYSGAGEEFSPGDKAPARARTAQRFAVDGPYLLYVGNLRPHKNADGLLRCLALLRSRNQLETKLLVLGGDGVGHESYEKRIVELGLAKDVVLRWAVPEAALIDAYRGAELLVLPSFEEGFGLPVLEAMACGTPVACSWSASMPEVGGDAAAYFDPYSDEDMARAISRVLGSEELQAAMRAKGLLQAKQFTWQRCAALHHEVYRRFLN